MRASLYSKLNNDGNTRTDCPLRHTLNDQWSQDLPAALKDLVVAPISFDVSRDYEMRAEHTDGRDTANQTCFSEFRFVLTQLCCDDDEVFYEVPVYAESLTSWRLVDERWLVCRTQVSHVDQSVGQTSLSVSDTMPR
jgi:hypothetical protein